MIGFIFGNLVTNKIDPRTYLASVSPDSIRMFLFNQSPLAGSLLLLALLTAAALASAALSFVLRNNDWLKNKARKTSESAQETIQSERVQNIIQNKYTRYVFLVVSAAALIILPRIWVATGIMCLAQWGFTLF